MPCRVVTPAFWQLVMMGATLVANWFAASLLTFTPVLGARVDVPLAVEKPLAGVVWF